MVGEVGRHSKQREQPGFGKLCALWGNAFACGERIVASLRKGSSTIDRELTPEDDNWPMTDF